MFTQYNLLCTFTRCLSLLPDAVGNNPAHFDLSIAREKHANVDSGNWLVLHLQDLISVAYQVLNVLAVILPANSSPNSMCYKNSEILLEHLPLFLNFFLQTSTIQFENMRAIGISLLSTIIDKVLFDQSFDLI